MRLLHDRSVLTRLSGQLTYTRGSVVPLCLSLQTSDLQALDVLSADRAAIVRLHRNLRITSTLLTAPGDPIINPNTLSKLDTAIWWPSSSQNVSTSTRMWQGEIALPKTLSPSACLDRFEIAVSVISYFYVLPIFIRHCTVQRRFSPLESYWVQSESSGERCPSGSSGRDRNYVSCWAAPGIVRSSTSDLTCIFVLYALWTISQCL